MILKLKKILNFLGDSGGPLFVQDRINGKTKFVIAGIVSYGSGCAIPEKPT